MGEYLIKTVETHRVATESEAAMLIDAAKAAMEFTLTKYTTQFKTAKQKGEVIDEWYLVTLHKQFTEEKEPTVITSIRYDNVLSSTPVTPIEKPKGFYNKDNELIEEFYEN